MKSRNYVLAVQLAALGAVLLLASLAFGQQVQITKGPVVEHTSADSAVVAWSTNESSSTVVKYGTDQNNLDQTAQAPWGGLTHRVTIKNLEPGKTYYFQVQSGQAQGGSSTMGQIGTFQTQGQGSAASNGGGNQYDQQFNITNGPNVEHVDNTTAVVAWSTDRPASSVVKYGTDPNNMTQTAQEPWGATTHRVTIKNLQPGTQYYFSVHSAQGKNAPGQAADTQPMSFTTTGAGQPASSGGGMAQNNQFRITNGPVLEHVGDTTATVAWSTDRPSSSIVKYGTDPNNLSQPAQEAWGATTHRVQIKNLQPNTQYYVAVHSAQGQNAPGQKADSSPVQFKTAAQGQQASNSNH